MHLVVVGLDTANVGRMLPSQNLHELVERRLELRNGGFRSLLALLLAARKHRLQDAVLRVRHGFPQIPEQQIVVLVQKTFHVVRHIPSVMAQAEFLNKNDFKNEQLYCF